MNAASLTWKQDLQDRARFSINAMLRDGKPSEALDSDELIYSSKTYSGETPDMIATKALNAWISNEVHRKRLQHPEFTSMVTGYTVEARELIYYIHVLFAK